MSNVCLSSSLTSLGLERRKRPLRCEVSFVFLGLGEKENRTIGRINGKTSAYTTGWGKLYKYLSKDSFAGPVSCSRTPPDSMHEPLLDQQPEKQMCQFPVFDDDGS